MDPIKLLRRTQQRVLNDGPLNKEVSVLSARSLNLETENKVDSCWIPLLSETFLLLCAILVCYLLFLLLLLFYFMQKERKGKKENDCLLSFPTHDE